MRRRAFVTSAALLAAVGARRPWAQVLPESKDLDTPYVPTPQRVVDTMLSMAQVGPRDFVIDLGSGDGRLIITAAKRHGARGFGVELDPRLVRFANQVAREQGVAERARFLEQDLFKTDFSQADVITMYLLPDVNIELRPKLLALRPGTRIVSHDYHLGDWRADAHRLLDVPEKTVGPKGQSDVWLWIVPAPVGGRWQGESRGMPISLDIAQSYQRVELTAQASGAPLKVLAAIVRGPDLRVAAERADGTPVQMHFQRHGDALSGEVRSGSGAPVAVRLARRS